MCIRDSNSNVKVSDEFLVKFQKGVDAVKEKNYEIAFRPFSRLDKSRNQNNHSGVGLGLSIANDVIRMHGGQLSLYKSAALGGLGVRIRLPI